MFTFVVNFGIAVPYTHCWKNQSTFPSVVIRSVGVRCFSTMRWKSSVDGFFPAYVVAKSVIMSMKS